MSRAPLENSALDGIAARSPCRHRISILGVPFDNVTLSEALHSIDQMVVSRRPHYVVTANVDFLVQAQRDVELHRILCEAHLALCDGTPVLWASRLLGNGLPERVAGSDLVPRLIELAENKGYRIFLLGASPESARQAVGRLRARHPSLVIAGYYSPPFKKLPEMDHEEIARQIECARPDLLFVSLGCPKQEKWLAMHYRALNVPVSIGVGATIDFLAGKVRRAPGWMQQTGTEWVFRLAQEPRRLFRRYLNDLLGFSLGLLNQSYYCRGSKLPLDPSHRPQPGSARHESPTAQALPYHVFCLPDWLNAATASQAKSLIDEALTRNCDCVLDLAQTRQVDSTGLGLLLGLRKDLERLDRKLVLLAPNRIVQRVLSRARVQVLFLSAPDLLTARAILAEFDTPSVGVDDTSASPTTLYWQGEILASNVADVWRQTRAQLKVLTGIDEYVVDLSRVRFIDSSGLGLMIQAKALALERHLKLHFAYPSAAVRNVLRLAGLEEFLLERSVDTGARRFLSLVARALGGGNHSAGEPALASESRS